MKRDSQRRTFIGACRRVGQTSAFIALGLSAVIVDAPAASAQQFDSWIVSEISGEALERGADGTWHALATGAILTPGAPVRTGARGRMVVTHRQDRLTVSPESEFEIPSSGDPATGPSLLQRLGTLLFSIEHTPQRRFEVKTPYLAAVVKGTVFTVSAGSASERVHVAQGAVEVAAAVSHDVVLVRPGETAVVASA